MVVPAAISYMHSSSSSSIGDYRTTIISKEKVRLPGRHREHSITSVENQPL